MDKAFIDTTILTNALLKTGEIKKKALKALSRFSTTELPVYAIKEFKAGPLSYYVWMHNKLASLDSFKMALDALQRMSLTPRRYTTATAIEALSQAAGSIAHFTPALVSKKHGENTPFDKILCDEFRIRLKVAVIKAWKKRRSITTDVTQPLPCFVEVPPEIKRGLISLDPKDCSIEGECYLGPKLKEKPELLIKLRNAIKNSEKAEHKCCSKTLRQIYRKPKLPVTKTECRKLGDAYFAFFHQKIL